jgi:L-threonylcarbamoyladenylate synthase
LSDKIASIHYLWVFVVLFDDSKDIEAAVAALRAGDLVAFPTETVYGLGADARSASALAKVFSAKGRPADHPLIVHIGDIGELSEWAREVPEAALVLARAFWPGALTLILRKTDGVLDLITGGQDTVGVRMPNHPLALGLLQGFGSGVAAPSANRFGRISPTSAQAVVEELGDSIRVLDGGRCLVGVESTIVDVSGGEVVVLRPGMISRACLESVLGGTVLMAGENKPRVSGSHESHYAPVTATKILSRADIESLNFEIFSGGVGLLLHSPIRFDADAVECVRISGEPEGYARDLYYLLRELDRMKLRVIYVEELPEGVEWDAVRDRVGRASFLK